MDMFPMWALPTNENIIQIILRPPGSKEHIIDFKGFISITSGRIMAMN